MSNPVLIIVLLLAAGTCLLAAGFWCIFGLGAGLVVTSIPFLLAAGVLLRGYGRV